MKLRIKGDSIRMRLTQTELNDFVAHRRVSAVLHFPSGRALVYALESSPDITELTARFLGNEITVRMPHAWTEEWATTDRVGFEGAQAIADGHYLSLLIEKDFECLHKRPDELDAFPHPLAGKEATD